MKEKVLRIHFHFFVIDLLLPHSLLFFAARCFVDDLVLLRGISPYEDAKHPLDIWSTEMSESARLLSLLLQRLHKEIKSINRVSVPLLALWYGMRFTTQDF